MHSVASQDASKNPCLGKQGDPPTKMAPPPSPPLPPSLSFVLLFITYQSVSGILYTLLISLLLAPSQLTVSPMGRETFFKLLFSPCPEEYVACSKHSVNVSWMNIRCQVTVTWRALTSQHAVLPRCFLKHQFTKCLTKSLCPGNPAFCSINFYFLLCSGPRPWNPL